MEKPLVVLGAGLSGLSLVAALLDRGYPGPVVVVDRRRRWADDRTWCTWLTGPLRGSDLAADAWTRWRVVLDGVASDGRSERHPYVRLRAADVYASLLARARSAPDVELRLGERVLALDRAGTAPVVATNAGRLAAGLVVDALGAASPLLDGPPESALALDQAFLGWEVETDRPVFDPSTATLMDIQRADPDGIDFRYELPSTRTRALLEHTTIGRREVAGAERRASLRRELDQRAGPGRWRILRREAGVIPMTPARFPRDHGPGTLTLGGAAGAVRPSSGYAYSRIQRHVEVVADAICACGPARLSDVVAPPVAPARYATLDRAFLAALRGARDGGASLFGRLVGDVDGDAFARFMTDASTPADERAIMAALPAGRMVAAGLRSLVAR